MNNKGFTLVELLAVVILLITISLFVMPRIVDVIKDGDKTKEDIAKNKIIEAAKEYTSNYDTNFLNDLVNVGDSKIIKKEDLLNSKLIDDKDLDELAFTNIVVTLKENNKIEYTLSSNNIETIHLIIDLDGGIGENKSGEYEAGTTITLSTPTRTGYVFSHWQVVNGNSVLSGNLITIGTLNTTVRAIWIKKVIITLDLDGGSINQTLNSNYAPGSTINLETPTRENSIFTGWTIVLGDSVISENLVTVGTIDTTIKALWKDVNLNNTYEYLSKNYSCGGTSIGTPVFTYTGACEILDDSSVLAGAWRIKFKSSGTLTFNSQIVIDAFLVGGGGNNTGSGGYTSTTKQFTLANTKSYSIVIGSAGNATSFEGIGIANAGGSGSNSQGGNNSGKDGVSTCGAREGDSGSECIWYKCEAPTAGSSYGNGATCEFGEGTASGCTRGDDFAYSASAGGCRNVCDLDTGTSGKGLTGDNSGRGGACSSTGYSGVVVIRNAR